MIKNISIAAADAGYKDKREYQHGGKSIFTLMSVILKTSDVIMENYLLQKQHHFKALCLLHSDI